MDNYNKLISNSGTIAVVGIGYVGLPLAVAFARKVNTIGFDINPEKIKLYESGNDPTNEVGDKIVRDTTVRFSSDEKILREACVFIVAVPTPVNIDHSPNLEPLRGASAVVGRNMKKGSIVVYESTVYPGVTEDICVPILEAESGLKYMDDFYVGYSPERINPGDKEHRLENIMKVVSGCNIDVCDEIAKIYELVIKAGVYKAKSIKIAEAAKVIENSQRDINIAFVNELSIIFNRMGIDTKSVLEAAATKWNFLSFAPGLVGGHCIGVDPYYLTYKAGELGYHSQVILAGRRINDDMGKYVAENCVKNLIKSDKLVTRARVAILGFTFKENCPDTRNTKVYDIISELREYGIEPIVVDPIANVAEVRKQYSISLESYNNIKNMDAIILAVAHNQFRQLSRFDFDRMYTSGEKVMIDIKGMLDMSEYVHNGYRYWRL